MKPKEYEALKAKFKQQYQEKLAALEIVWEASKEEVVSAPKQRADANTAAASESESVVQKWVDASHGQFTTAQVKETLGAEIKDATLRGILKRFVKSGSVKLLIPGRGKRAGVYERIEKKTGDSH